MKAGLPGSVRFRLTLWFVAILVLVLAGFSAFIYTRQVQVLRSEAGLRLASLADRLSLYYLTLLREVEHEGEAPGTGIAGDQPLLQAGDVLALIGPQNQVLAQSAGFSDADLRAVLAAAQNGATVAYQLPGDGGRRQEALFSVSPLRYERDVIGLLVVGTPVDPGAQLPRLAFTLGLGSLVVALAAFGGGFWLADRAMRPVEVITRAAREIGEGDLSRRLNLGRRDELGELADTFDGMLSRLQAAFERQRRFTADASHELRTPLTIIELEANRALEHRRSPEEYAAALGVIQSENERMSRLVNELLTLARMDAGQTLMRREALDLSDLAVEVVSRLLPVAARRGANLQTGELGEAPACGDRVLLTQMISNLVENALKHAGGPGLRVVVESGSAVRSGRPGGWVTVTDDGQGIAPEHLPHLFERFYRVDAARSRADDDPADAAASSGLGLAIVQGVAQAHGGAVEVSSRPGEGTRFRVWIPQ